MSQTSAADASDESFSFYKLLEARVFYSEMVRQIETDDHHRSDQKNMDECTRLYSTWKRELRCSLVASEGAICALKRQLTDCSITDAVKGARIEKIMFAAPSHTFDTMIRDNVVCVDGLTDLDALLVQLDRSLDKYNGTNFVNWSIVVCGVAASLFGAILIVLPIAGIIVNIVAEGTSLFVGAPILWLGVYGVWKGYTQVKYDAAQRIETKKQHVKLTKEFKQLAGLVLCYTRDLRTEKAEQDCLTRFVELKPKKDMCASFDKLYKKAMESVISEGEADAV